MELPPLAYGRGHGEHLRRSEANASIQRGQHRNHDCDHHDDQGRAVRRLSGGTAETDELLKECGAKNLRLMAGLAAGEGSGSIVSTSEADDFAEFGKVTQAFFTNGRAEVMEGVGSADSPIASWQNSIFVDIPR